MPNPKNTRKVDQFSRAGNYTGVNAKSNTQRSQERISHVYSLMMRGLNNHQIYEECMPKWGITKRTVDFYMHDARKLITEYASKNLNLIMEEHINKYNNVYFECCKLGKYREALAALGAIDKLKGLVKDRVDITSNGNTLGAVINIIKPDDNNI